MGAGREPYEEQAEGVDVVDVLEGGGGADSDERRRERGGCL